MSAVKALVTGGSGFIGARLARSMLECGMSVSATYRGTHPEIPGVAWCRLTRLDSADECSRVVAGADFVVHLAALVHQEGCAAEVRWPDFERVNVEGTRTLARSCVQAGVRRFVFMSSISVYGRSSPRVDEQTAMRPDDDYGRSKLVAEEALQSELARAATDWCILRPPLVYGRDSPGNLARLRSVVARGLPLPLATVQNRRSFIFVDNLTDAVLAVLRHTAPIRKAYVLSDDSDFATPDIVAALAVGSGHRARLWRIPLPVLRFLGRAGDFSQSVLRMRSGIDSRSIDSLVGSLLVDSSRFREAFHWCPPIPGARAFESVYGASP